MHNSRQDDYFGSHEKIVRSSFVFCKQLIVVCYTYGIRGLLFFGILWTDVIQSILSVTSSGILFLEVCKRSVFDIQVLIKIKLQMENEQHR